MNLIHAGFEHSEKVLEITSLSKRKAKQTLVQDSFFWKNPVINDDNIQKCNVYVIRITYAGVGCNNMILNIKIEFTKDSYIPCLPIG